MDDPELLALVELEVRDLLNQYGCPGDRTRVVPVSATGTTLAGESRWVAALVDLLDAVECFVPDPLRNLDRPFLMSVESVLTISGTVVTGESTAAGSPSASRSRSWASVRRGRQW